MKKNNFFRVLNSGIMIISLFAVSMLFTTCDDKDKETGDPYFTIEGDPTGLAVTTSGITQSYIVRSNRPWQIVAQSEGDWIQVFPDEGDDDGIFKIIVDNNDSFDTRLMNYAFVVDGEEQPVLFRVEQDANVAFITITGGESGIFIPAKGGDFTIDISSNVNWTYSLDDSSWLTESSVTSSSIVLTAARNYGDQRSVQLTLTCTDAGHTDVTATASLIQSSGSVILEEDFSWITGSAYYSFYATTDARRYDSWTAEELAHGWTTTPNTYSSSQPLLYACIQCVKLGKTGYAGDLISPALDLDETKDVQVTFKAVPYMTKAGTKDDNLLKIFVLGAGTPSVSEFTIDNWPTYPADETEHETYCQAFWNVEDPSATRTFTITGATSATQIQFLGGADYYLVGVGAGKNRIFIDDIKVEILP